MKAGGVREAAKQVLGVLPLTAEVAQWLRPGHGLPIRGYSLEALAKALPRWVEAGRCARQAGAQARPKRVLVVGYLRWWVEYATAMAVYLAGIGHDVDLAIVPYRRWDEAVEAFDRRRQSLYMRRLLSMGRGLFGVRDLSAGPHVRLPADLERALEEQSRIDVQYTVQHEMLDMQGGSRDRALLRLRRERNLAAACTAFAWLRPRAYDVVIIPNGSLLEFGAVYHTARFLGLPAVTFDFGEQRERLWLAQNAEAMRLDMSALWELRGGLPLGEAELGAMERLYQARRGGKTWANFRRQWQAGESQGAQAARKQLGLDPHRPVALLATNVVGDSLALGRQIFTRGMADWLGYTVRYFAERPQAQLVVRVHPGELLGAGHPSVEIVRSTLPQLPEHVIVIPPDSPVNTYDLIEVAHLGLVYTTTVGMEMAMRGLPVIVAGHTHYRGKGFTHDPETIDGYRQALDHLLGQPPGARLEPWQVDRATRYAYRFFFEYPFPFPWHLLQFWEDVAARPLEHVLAPEGRERYGETLEALTGAPIDWGRHAALQAERVGHAR